MARRKPPTTHGLLVIDKPAGMTSHDVVAKVRKRFGERQVGHAGTLDPDATGVLLVGVGKGTKVMRFLTALGKTYRGQVRLGSTTDSLDSTGVVTGNFAMTGVTLEDAKRVVAQSLTGPIMQIPPMVSAVRVDGVRLHQLARQGIEVERQPRPVTVYRFDIAATDDPLVFDIEVHCSAGTYIRTLADDLGRLLGGGGHLHGLRRTAVGSLTIEESGTIDDAALMTLAEAVRDLPAVTVDAAVAAGVAHGRFLPCPAGDGPWAVCDEAGELLAIYEPREDGVTAKPAVVLVDSPT
ncbi:MAG TPA: tRNA pseudouridine(55) synthase TruB [Ilumatobacteraceae bacterium]|nr:tRNA pseudouridine(55) synthase TruB [Ilumatobacteraceae bacterium]